MPEVTLTPQTLQAINPNHPALTKSGRWTRQAQRVLRSRKMRSRWDGRKPSKPVRNTALFYRIADEIEVFPEEYNQSVWGNRRKNTPCGTAFCIAGHGAHLTGWNPRTFSDNSADWTLVQRGDGTRVYAESVGQRELGLTDEEASFLFNSSWRPKYGRTVPQVLRQIGDGARISEVSRRYRTESIEDYGYRLDRLKADEKDRKIRVTGRKPVYS